MSNIIMIVSSALVRLRARRLPAALALRMEEEWLGELNSITGGLAKLAFAAALILTRRQAFVVPGEETVVTVHDRPSLGSRKSLLVLSTVGFAIAAYGASFLLPVTYEAAATIQVEEAGDLVLQQARSRSFFASIVTDMKPKDAEERDRMFADLNDNTTVLPVRETSLFVVKYRGDDRTMSREMTRRLAISLIEFTMRQRWDKSQAEAQYLRSQLKQLSESVRVKSEELARSEPESRGILTLDHEVLVSSYKALFAKYQDAKMAAELQSAPVRILDLPELGTPISPNRKAFAVIGALAGFALGVMAVVGRGRRQPPAVTAPA